MKKLLFYLFSYRQMMLYNQGVSAVDAIFPAWLEGIAAFAASGRLGKATHTLCDRPARNALRAFQYGDCFLLQR